MTGVQTCALPISGLQSIGAIGAGILGTAVLPVAIVGGLIGGGIAISKTLSKRSNKCSVKWQTLEKNKNVFAIEIKFVLINIVIHKFFI